MLTVQEVQELVGGLLLPCLASGKEQRALVEGVEAVARLPVDRDGLVLAGAADPIPAERERSRLRIAAQAEKRADRRSAGAVLLEISPVHPVSLPCSPAQLLDTERSCSGG